jgi:hypothetical protein
VDRSLRNEAAHHAAAAPVMMATASAIVCDSGVTTALRTAVSPAVSLLESSLPHAASISVAAAATVARLRTRIGMYFKTSPQDENDTIRTKSNWHNPRVGSSRASGQQSHQEDQARSGSRTGRTTAPDRCSTRRQTRLVTPHHHPTLKSEVPLINPPGLCRVFDEEVRSVACCFDDFSVAFVGVTDERCGSFRRLSELHMAGNQARDPHLMVDVDVGNGVKPFFGRRPWISIE